MPPVLKSVRIAIGLMIAVVLILAMFNPWTWIFLGIWFQPNPPKPDIKYGEFDGFYVDEGRGKTRKWKYHFKNEQDHEIFVYDRSPDFPKLVLENIDQYKIILGVATAEYFLAEPEYKWIPEMPYIDAYDTGVNQYLFQEEINELLDNHSFKVIDWYCDPPIENTFK